MILSPRLGELLGMMPGRTAYKTSATTVGDTTPVVATKLSFPLKRPKVGGPLGM